MKKLKVFQQFCWSCRVQLVLVLSIEYQSVHGSVVQKYRWNLHNVKCTIIVIRVKVSKFMNCPVWILNLRYFFFFFWQILFMNKTDLFQEKILHSGRHLRFYLSNYTGMWWRIGQWIRLVYVYSFGCNITVSFWFLLGHGHVQYVSLHPTLRVLQSTPYVLI